MSDHTRADDGEGREPGQDTIREQRDAAMASVARLTAAIEMNAREVASGGLPDEAKWLLAAKDQWQRSAALANERAAQAETEVARLTAALAEAERERDAAVAVQEMCAMSGGFYARHSENATNRAEAAEASASALRERVATLEAALQPFAKSGELFSPRHPDDYDQAIYTPAAGQEYSLCGDHLRAARTALEAPHADK